jgi:hypothetical protein
MFKPRENDPFFFIFWFITVFLVLGFFFGTPVSIVVTALLAHTVAPIVGINQFVLVLFVVVGLILLLRACIYYGIERPMWGDN